MLLSYFKLSLRLLARNPFFTFVSVAGLSVGFATFFILWPFSMRELRSDQFIPDHDRIFRLMVDWRWTDDGKSWGREHLSSSIGGIAPEVAHHSEIEAFTRFLPQPSFRENNSPVSTSQIVLSLADKPAETRIKLPPQTAICADKNFFEFFGIEMIEGNRITALQDDAAIVLSESMAAAIFKGPVLNQQLVLNNKLFIVTGVFKDIPTHSHLNFDIVVSNSGKLGVWNALTLMNSAYCSQYFKMRPGAPPLSEILNRDKQRLFGWFLERNQQFKIDFLSIELKDIAFSEANESFVPKSRFMLTILSMVSLAVLVMAWMNYVNFTLSRTTTRFKEIAARKISGAHLPDLFIQFVCQSAVTNILAVLIAVTLMQAIRIPFSHLLNIEVTAFSELDITTLAFFGAIVLSGTLVTAAYPAWITLRHTTRQLLTGQEPRRKRFTTTAFTTFQYVAAIALIAGIFVIYSQLNFILDKDLGIDRENVVIVDAPFLGLKAMGQDRLVSFAEEIRNMSGVLDVSLSASVCGETSLYAEVRRHGSERYVGVDSQGRVDENFLPMYGLTLIAGRNFYRDEDGSSLIVSRLTLQRVGYPSPETAIGAVMDLRIAGEWRQFAIIGAVEDYRTRSFYNIENGTSVDSRGQILTYMKNPLWPGYAPSKISIKFDARALSSITAVEKLYYNAFPGNVFNWSFLDEKINQQYSDQEITRNQLTFFTALAVIVACLGLLGMVANTIAEKTKEISVRRILGADIVHVITMLTRSTAGQVLIAIVVGLPVAWQFSNRYLQTFSERVQLEWWHFTVPVLILLGTMFMTVALLLWKAAHTNPVEALKCE